MGHPDGAHTHGSSGGGGLVVVLVVLAVVGAVLHAIWHTLVEVVEIVALVLVSAAGLAVAAGAVYAGVRIRARVLEARDRRTVPARAQVIRLGAEPERPAVEAPRQRPAAWPLSSWEEIRTDRRGHRL
jgi:hypothetical protein